MWLAVEGDGKLLCEEQNHTAGLLFSSIWAHDLSCFCCELIYRPRVTLWWAFLSQESGKDDPELIKTWAVSSEKGRQACDHLEKKYFWRLRREEEETSSHFKVSCEVEADVNCYCLWSREVCLPGSIFEMTPLKQRYEILLVPVGWWSLWAGNLQGES